MFGKENVMLCLRYNDNFELYCLDEGCLVS